MFDVTDMVLGSMVFPTLLHSYNSHSYNSHSYNSGSYSSRSCDCKRKKLRVSEPEPPKPPKPIKWLNAETSGYLIVEHLVFHGLLKSAEGPDKKSSE